MAYRCPHVRSLQAEAIHEGDFFDHMQGSTTFLKYRKSLRKRGGLIGAFSHVHLASGIELACVLRPDDLLKVRACSETYGALVRAAETAKERAAAERRLAETPWVLWEDSMAAKS
ncbi:recombinase RecT, partial [Azohydromonas australica]|uniref:recombinase RecT n=1 Tax=Azohydromonas australica TaxID=364039 RepID=UPI001EE4CA11